ncbi:ParB N-terminal domain-containing protein [Streptomyces qinglanensis]|uniref:ParB N-terminal domain-containing protein n=1 Tax=Streptomyces qinglanensis TaxID=943816 RepID=UPI0037BC06B4
MSALPEYPLPPRNERFERLLKLRLEEAGKAGGTRESVTVDWNGKALHVDVIDLPLDELLFNPATHRIRAQCSHDRARQRTLEAGPWRTESQDYLASLLQAMPTEPTKRDPDFDKLKEDLREYGQNEPGLVTHHGIIVNGNTRAAALRELGVTTIRVGVLPASFTWDDITAVELSLQLRNDSRREYSYINRLLAIDERIRLGLSREAIAKEFRCTTKTVDQHVWILQHIRDQIARSESEGVALPLVAFEGKQERLKELHRDYMNLAKNNPDGAEALKEYRTSAILLDFAKTDVRFIDESFFDDHLSKELPESLVPATAGMPEAKVAIPGLDVAMPAVSQRVETARSVTRQVRQAAARLGSRHVDEGAKREAYGVRDEAKKAFDEALTSAGRVARLRKRKQLAPERLKEATASLELCIEEIVKARGARVFDEEDFGEAALQFRTVFRQLASQLGRGSEEPGAGVSWLLKAAALKEDE